MSPQPLQQQELLAAPPTRRIIVPRGFAAHWGVDVSVSRVSIAYAASGGRCAARTASFARLEGGARLARIWAETASFVHDLLCDDFPLPGIVMVEQPSGARPNPPLSYAVGVVMGAVYSAIDDRYGGPVLVETCSSAWWKKVACGKGNIYKPKKGEPTESYGVLQWARANGYTGWSWDEADALGIAEAARRTVALDER